MLLLIADILLIAFNVYAIAKAIKARRSANK